MSEEDDSRGPEQETGPFGPPAGDEESLDGRENHGSPANRLPPPAFPPGERRRAIRKRSRIEAPDTKAPSGESLEGAFISPDDPIRKEGRGIPEDAFISPDDPLVSSLRNEEGHATGMSLLPTPQTEAGSSHRKKPSIHELPWLLDQLAEQLHEGGEKALEVHPDMGHFQASLRAFLKGYLEGSRE